MRRNRDLIIAFGSLVAVNMVLPLLDSLTSMAISAINKTVNQWQIDMQIAQVEVEAETKTVVPSTTHAIGFAIPTEEEYIDED